MSVVRRCCFLMALAAVIGGKGGNAHPSALPVHAVPAPSQTATSGTTNIEPVVTGNTSTDPVPVATKPVPLPTKPVPGKDKRPSSLDSFLKSFGLLWSDMKRVFSQIRTKRRDDGKEVGDLDVVSDEVEVEVGASEDDDHKSAALLDDLGNVFGNMADFWEKYGRGRRSQTTGNTHGDLASGQLLPVSGATVELKPILDSARDFVREVMKTVGYVVVVMRDPLPREQLIDQKKPTYSGEHPEVDGASGDGDNSDENQRSKVAEEPAEKEPDTEKSDTKEPAAKEQDTEERSSNGPDTKEPAEKQPAEKELAEKEPAEKEPVSRERSFEVEPVADESVSLERALEQAASNELDAEEPVHNVRSSEVDVPTTEEPASEELDVVAPGEKDATQEGRIIGGSLAKQGQFPWQTAIKLNGNFRCGGAIIAPRWVVTAGHCVEGVTVGRRLEVVVGSLTSNPGQSYYTKAIHLHEDYTDEDDILLANDIALMQFAEDIIYSKHVQPVRLPRRSQSTELLVGETVVIAGWGKTHDANTGASAVLMYVDLPVISNEECSEVLGDTPMILETNLCVAAKRNRATCNGDSGGPLVWREEDGLYTLVGVVSFGVSDGCEAGMPNVFTRVTSFTDWIARRTGIEVLD